MLSGCLDEELTECGGLSDGVIIRGWMRAADFCACLTLAAYGFYSYFLAGYLACLDERK